VSIRIANISLLPLLLLASCAAESQQSATLSTSTSPGLMSASVSPQEQVPLSQPTTSQTPILDSDTWTTYRIAGDLFTSVEFRDGNYYSGRVSVTTPLPEGYPAPTPPAAIELKKYPSVRRAEYSASMNGDTGRNIAFWPLFNHIKKRDIAMTSPVEMDYPNLKIDAIGETAKSDSKATENWTMSFLYRESGLGPTGEDGKVRIVDTQPVTVLSLGMMGQYSTYRDQIGLAKLKAWLDTQSEWEVVGPARAFYYNGPDAAIARQWSEIQLPVQRKTTSN